MVDAVAAPSVPAVATPEQKARIDKVAKDFETSFLEVMLGQMFSTVDTGSFGGGEGEGAFKSFLTSAFAKSMTAHGGVGVAKQMTHELLKMQGLSEGPIAQ